MGLSEAMNFSFSAMMFLNCCSRSALPDASFTLHFPLNKAMFFHWFFNNISTYRNTKLFHLHINRSHNYGHGYKNLCSVMTMLMMLYFLIDQVQQLCCKIYQKARKHARRLTTLFERVRVLTEIGVFDSWQRLYTFIGDPTSRPPPGEYGLLIG